MTPLNKPVKRMSEAVVRDMGRLKRLAITIYPNDMIGLRPERTRREELVPMRTVYDLAVKLRSRAEKAEKKARKVSRGKR